MKIIRCFVSAGLIACFSAVSLAQTGSLTCTSNDGSYHYCRANTHNQVRLVRQLPGPRCQLNYSWGFDYRGIWVDRGCHAQFDFGRSDSNSSGTDTAIAAGILGAIILGAAVAGANSDNDGDRAAQQRNYYRDGYRLGQQDWDNNRPPAYTAYRNRFPSQFERDFASGYDSGYNNRKAASFHDEYRSNPGWDRDGGREWRNRQDIGTNDPDRGTINNPGHGVSGAEEKIITCSDNSGGGNHCNAITAGGVDMVHQRSGSPCQENYSWGVDQSGIWVSHGCRADFVLHGVAAY